MIGCMEISTLRQGGGKLPLVGNIDEGFIVTDILLYGAICESALFDLIQYVYKYDEGRKNIEEVKNCFEHEVPKVHKLSNQKVKFVNNGKETNGSFCFSWKESKLKSNSQINFEDLIHAGKALAVYDAGLEEKLHQLRINRNSVHLSEQITQKYIKKHRYSKRDREVAQKTTEELRIHLHNWYYDNVYIF